MHHSDASFNKLCEYVHKSYRLRELNVSWQCRRPPAFHDLLKVIKDDRQLVSLTLSWNIFLEEQPIRPTEKQKKRGCTYAPLNKVNTKILDCLVEFIKYNTNLLHLDLSNCGLIEVAIQYLVSCLKKSQALQSLHFDGNPGLCKEIIDWVVERINGVPKPPAINIPPMNSEFKYRDYEHGPMQKDGLIKILRRKETVSK